MTRTETEIREVVEGRLLARLKRDESSGCLLWTGSIPPEGYVQVRVGGRRTGIHRFMYEQRVGPIPAGLHLDHLCRVRHCAEPAHLEPVTPRENMMRGILGCVGRCPHLSSRTPQE